MVKLLYKMIRLFLAKINLMNYGKTLKKWIYFVTGHFARKRQTKMGLIYAVLNNGLKITVKLILELKC